MSEYRADDHHDFVAEETPESHVLCRHGDAILAVHITSNGAMATSASRDNAVGIFDLKNADNNRKIEMPPGPIIDVCISNKVTAVTLESGAVHVFDTAAPHHVVFSRHDMRAVCAKLSCTGKTLASASDKLVVVTNLETRQDVYFYRIAEPNDSIYRISVNGNVSKVFILAAEGAGSSSAISSYVLICDTTRSDCCSQLRLQVLSHFYADICADANGTLLAIADDHSLTLCDVHQNACVALKQYEAPEGENKCAMTPCGTFVVAAVAKNNFGLWNCLEQVKLATLQTNIIGVSNNPSCCAISDDGQTIIGGCSDYSVRVWSLNDNRTSDRCLNRSSLEVAFAQALAKPDLLNMNYILDIIRSENVKSTTDLFLGHNLVLLAIRSGIITKENIETLGGTQNFLKNELYYPATQLRDESGNLIDAVIRHAEKIGIIENGDVLILTREMAGVKDSVSALEDRMLAVEQRVDSLGGHYDELASSVGAMARDQERTQKRISNLADSLTQLQSNIRRRDRRMIYATIVRCVLSFVPLMGNALGEVAFLGAEIVQNLTVDDMVEPVVDCAKWFVSHTMEVDLSSFRVACDVFSEDTLSKLNERARANIGTAVDRSTIGSYSELNTVLASAILGTETNENNIWNVKVAANVAEDPVWSNIESIARIKFKYAVLCQGESANSLQYGRGVKALNELLNDAPGLHSVQDVENKFLHVVGDGTLSFSEESFILVLRGIYEEQHYMKEFKACAMDNLLSLEMAARLMQKLGAEMLGPRHSMSIPQADDVRKVLGNLDHDGDGYIDGEAFLAATKQLLRNSPL